MLEVAQNAVEHALDDRTATVSPTPTTNAKAGRTPIEYRQQRHYDHDMSERTHDGTQRHLGDPMTVNNRADDGPFTDRDEAPDGRPDLRRTNGIQDPTVRSESRSRQSSTSLSTPIMWGAWTGRETW